MGEGESGREMNEINDTQDQTDGKRQFPTAALHDIGFRRIAFWKARGPRDGAAMSYGT